MNKFRAYCAGLLICSFFFSTIRPLAAQNFPKHLEKEFRLDATAKVTAVVKIYTEAKVDFEQKGAKAFIEKISTLAPKAFTESEKAFFTKRIGKEKNLPSLFVVDDKMVGLEKNQIIFNLNTLDVAQGKFFFEENPLIMNPNKSPVENYEAWMGIKRYSFLNGLFFPVAHAAKKKSSKGKAALIGALIGGLLGAFLGPKIVQWFKGKKEPAVETHSPEFDAAVAAAQAQTQAPAPTTTETPTPTPAPTTTEKDSTTPEEPDPKDTTPTAAEKDKEENTKSKYDAKAFAYIKEYAIKIFNTDKISDEAAFEKLKEESSFPSFILLMLQIVEHDFKNKKITADEAKTIINTLSLKDGKPINTLNTETAGAIEQAITRIDKK